jgi:hypothetical protein
VGNGLLVALTLLAAASSAPAASAATFYASQNDVGAGNCSSAANACDLTQAVLTADADGTRDTIRVVGPLTHAGHLALNASPIDLIGSGRGAGGTLVETGAFGDPVLTLGMGSTASGLRARHTFNGGGSLNGVRMDRGTALRDASAEVQSGAAVQYVDTSGVGDEAVIERTAVVSGSAANNFGVQALMTNSAASRLRIADSTITADVGIEAAGIGTVVLQRSAIDAESAGVAVFPVSTDGTSRLRASGTTIRLRAGGTGTPAAVQISGGDSAARHGSADLRQVTFDGSAITGDKGVAAASTLPGTATAVIRGSIVRGFDSDLATGPGATSKITVGTSSFATAAAAAGTIDQASLGGNVNLVPQFVDPVAFDYRLKPTSPLIDRAGAAAIAVDESPTDRLGGPRILDGNGDGLPARDIGAFEHPAVAPPRAFAGCPRQGNLIELGSGNDARDGTLAADLIFAGPGNDTIGGLGGDDCIDLGAGNDRGDGGSGNDLVLGGFGSDLVGGGDGNDLLRGSEGGDRILGGFGDDTLHGESEGDRIAGSRGRDRINGGSGNDRLAGESNGDRISGDSGTDRIDGGSGNDRLSGNSGSDRITGGSGADRISAGTGNDRVSARDGRRDRIDCGRGRDRVTADRRDRVSRNCERVRRRR